MQLVGEDLLCPACAGFVHPFLDACPGCGAGRESRLDAAVAAGSLGARALIEADQTRRHVHDVALRYSLKPHAPQPTEVLADGFANVAASIAYRAAAAADGPTSRLPVGAATADTAAVTLADGVLGVHARPSGRALAAVPLEAIIAATPIANGRPPAPAWAGVRVRGRVALPRRPLDDGDLLITFGGPDAAGQVAIGNRRGLLADRPRSDHYRILARWLGILATAAAESRWVEIGPEAYVAGLGLGGPAAATAGVGPGGPAAAAGPTVAPGGAPAAGAAPGPGSSEPAPGVRAALEQLDELRDAGLISDAEYAAKRREILARL